LRGSNPADLKPDRQQRVIHPIEFTIYLSEDWAIAYQSGRGQTVNGNLLVADGGRGGGLGLGELED
jgi:hypothetical protein